jgi:UDP-N-acetylglucosamine--N-acetylmuramyl-(pentapeptide) pyrophosphoryl-undecaprenol N-acetylglucosamine transferase
VVLAFGGSLGSRALNEALLAGWTDAEEHSAIRLIWQTGDRYYDRVRERIDDSPRVRVVRYIDDMPAAYAAADLAICRSGAITCSELLATGTPAVLVPSPNVAEDHQTRNAESLVQAGAAVLLPETSLEAEWVRTVSELLRDSGRRDRMTRNALAARRIDAAEKLAEAVLRHAESRRRAA